MSSYERNRVCRSVYAYQARFVDLKTEHVKMDDRAEITKAIRHKSDIVISGHAAYSFVQAHFNTDSILHAILCKICDVFTMMLLNWFKFVKIR